MRRSAFIAGAAVIGLTTAAIVAPAHAQKFRSGLYAFHTGKMGDCPGLDWHLTLEPSGDLIGFVAWDQMQHMAKLQGKMSPDGDFSMNAQEVGGQGRTAVVKGSASGDYTSATITGSGSACDGKTIQIPRATGGMGGGGG